jgi:apolipoprotein D and lipocalin family protein
LKNLLRTILATLVMIAFSGAAGAFVQIPSIFGSTPENPPEVVKYVDLNRFSGLWYEIARFPNSYQEGCINSRATYTANPDGTVKVNNLCDVHAEEKSLSGDAVVDDPATNAKWKVTFLWPLTGDYWIIVLDDDYTYTVISEPDREKLWILAREKTLPENIYNDIIKRLSANGYDTSRLIKTTHQ